MRPPHVALAIAISSGRLLVAAILLALVGLLAILVVARRAGDARRIADEPLKRLNGFHIFGPDEDDEPLIHVPLLRGRRAEPLPRDEAGGRASAGARPLPPKPGTARSGHLPLPAAHRPAAPAPNGTSASHSAPATPRPAADPPPTRRPATAARAGTPGRPAPARAALAVPPPPSARAAARAAAAAPRAAATAVPLADPPPARPRRPTASRPLPALTWNAAAPAAASAGDPSPEHPRSQERELLGSAAPTPTPPPQAQAAPRQEGIRSGDILLVEDDVTIAGMYQMLLRTRGYDSRHAHDGVEGITMVRDERPALILLDMMMPRMDGIQFLEALRGWPRTADIPVVILSNVGDRPLVDRALALGAVEYLVKAQTRPQVLLGALPHWLRGNRALTTLS